MKKALPIFLGLLVAYLVFFKNNTDESTEEEEEKKSKTATLSAEQEAAIKTAAEIVKVAQENGFTDPIALYAAAKKAGANDYAAGIATVQYTDILTNYQQAKSYGETVNTGGIINANPISQLAYENLTTAYRIYSN
jgi:hypothetical protein